MSYQEKTKTRIRAAPAGLGKRLGMLAMRRRLSVMDIAQRTGASRTTVYSWFAGGPVTNAYKPAIASLLQELRS